MNKLPIEKRIQILSMLVEGSSMRSISRVADVSLNTVAKLLIDAGNVCSAHHDLNVRSINAKRVQADELWSFCYSKQKKVPADKIGEAGDVWTWTAIDADSKLICSYLVGGRDAEYALAFMDDLAGRLADRVQLITDGHGAYPQAVDEAFDANSDYAMLIKRYGAPVGQGPERRYSPAECTGIEKRRIQGGPSIKDVSTSFVERHNLSLRMSMRRYTRLTNAFSKKLENHIHALALYFTVYNFVRIHKSIKTTPALQAGITDKLWSMADIAELIEANEPPPKKRGPYKKKISN